MKLNRKVFITLGILVLYFVLRGFSLHMSLLFSGYDLGEITYLQKEATSYQNREFCVLATETVRSGEPALIRMEKNLLGFWSIADSAVVSSADGRPHAELQWVNTELTGGDCWYGAAPPYQEEQHYAYCGIDVADRLDLADLLPKNMTALVLQSGDAYVIHVISFEYAERYEDYKDFDLLEILRTNGYIS